MRLTEKRNNEIGYGYKEYSSEGSAAITKKLGQLEDIEEELGIDLITLFKVLNYPIYIKENYDGTNIDKTLWCSNCLMCGIGEPIIKVDEYAVYTKDYGKTWALTKEELE